MYVCVCFIVCPLSIHTVFSVLVHPALVQIHFSWSVSFFQPGQSLSPFLSSLATWTKDVLPWFHPWCDALQSARFNTLICQRVRCLSCIFSRYNSPALFSLFSLVLCGTTTVNSSVMTSVSIHLSSGGPGPFLREVPPTQRQDTINKTMHIFL